MTEERVNEGWGMIRPGDRVYHYYVNSDSLCRHVFFYIGELDPMDPTETTPRKDDCKLCFRKLMKRREKRSD